MKKILVMPNSTNLELILSSNVDGIILPLKGLSVESEVYFTLTDIKKIINRTKKEICVCINKIIHESDLKNLELSLITLNKLNITKIFFYDVSVLKMCKDLHINKELVVYQEHLNASSLTNKFYLTKGVSYSLITNDITKEEINKISESMPLMMMCYGYLPIFYSRRYLVSNYLTYINKEKTSDIYYIKHNEDFYPIKEEEYGTCIYTKEPINLINQIDEINADYIILNSFLISNDEFIKVLDSYIMQRKDNFNHYLGFLEEKTTYKVKKDE